MSADQKQPVQVEVELAQSLGLAAALTIGLGTMIGAGIFVLPGLVIAETGRGALLSFLLAGLVALLVALCTAEVATGMPKSGGGYYFISRAMGPVWGAVVGWGTWFALVFATAFYAVGFGEYVAGYIDGSPKALAVALTVLLVGLNFAGAQAAGRAQVVIVALLVAVLFLFLGRTAVVADPGLLRSAGGSGVGVAAVLSGTALLFVTYCGFGEIASVAEEVRDPDRNLPLAIIGSVVLVTLLYLAVIALLLMSRPLAEIQGPTVLADVSGDLMGPIGRTVIVLGAVLATVSSANASILSASRVSFAMGRDSLIPETLSRVEPRFRVPRRAIGLTGVLIVAVVVLVDLKHLAEAAGLLHLLLYGLVCVACIVLRERGGPDYRPTFRAPLFPAVPVLGAIGCLGVMLFMDRVTIAVALGVVSLALIHYWFYGRKRTKLGRGDD